MRRDPTQFRERFKRWKAGEKVYENGLPSYYVRREKPGLKIKGGQFPKFTMGTEGDNTPEWLRKKLEGQTVVQPDNIAVHREPVVQPVKRQVAKSPVIPESWIEKRQQLQPIIRPGKSYTQRRIDEETKRTWLSDAADIAHAIGEGAMIASNFVTPGIAEGVYPAYQTIRNTVRPFTKYIDVERVLHNIKNRNQFFYRDMAPYSYEHPYKKGLNALKSILTEEKINLPVDYIPQWMYDTTGAGTIGYLGPVRRDIASSAVDNPTNEAMKAFDDYAKNQVLLQNRFRDAAYRKYLNLPERDPVYIKNPTNNTYAYNLPYIKTLYNEYGISPDTYAMSQNADWLTSNAGKLEKSEIIPFGYGTSTDFDKSYSVQHMVDTWDLHPFKRSEDQIWQKYRNFVQNKANKIYINMYDWLYKNRVPYEYLGGKYLNRIRYDANAVPFKNIVQKISKKAQDFEAGIVLGGKPFTMDSWIPLTTKHDFERGGDIIQNVGFDAQNILPQGYFDWIKTQAFPRAMYNVIIK